MSPLVHLSILLCASLALVTAHCAIPKWTAQARALLLGSAALVLVPALLPEAWSAKEGGLEAVTEGALLALVGLGLVRRNPWVALGALLLLLEELDYGQVLRPELSTPAILETLGSRSTRFNFHNIPGLDGAWRLLPMIALGWLSRVAAPPVGLPRLHRDTLLAVVVTLGLSLPAIFLVGDEVWNESFELALVAIAGVGWLAVETREDDDADR